MRNRKNIFLLLSIALLGFLAACTKEYSREGLSASAFQQASGSCGNVLVYGVYVKDSALDATNYIVASINISSSGNYRLYTDTVNGCWFTMDAAAYAFDNGPRTIKMIGHGAPRKVDTSLFTLHFGGATSTFKVVCILQNPYIYSKTENDYFPMGGRSYCTYDTIDNASVKDSIRYTISPITQTINGDVYHVFLSSRNDTNFYRKDGTGKYYRFFQFTKTTSIAYTCLDDQQPEYGSWQTPDFTVSYNGISFNATLRCTLIAKDIKLTLSNKDKTVIVDSVMRVEEAVLPKTTSGGYGSAVATNTAYYAKRVGLVRYDIPATSQILKARNWKIY